MGFLKKWKQIRQVKKIVNDINLFDESVKAVTNNVSLKNKINELVEQYNLKNKVPIPKDVVEIVFELAEAIRSGDIKKSALKQKLAMKFIELLLGITGEIAKKMIWKVLIRL